MNTLKDKVVIVTGASSGIGRACAIAFAHEGCKVMLAARNKEKLDETAAYITSQGGVACVCVTDVKEEEACKNLIEQTIKQFAGIDILINNAGNSMRAVFNGVELNVLRQLMEINFWGTVYCTYYAMPHLLKQKGTVAGVSSIAGMKGLPGRTGYSASKFAMQGFLEALRIENLHAGLHVMVICPGYTESNIRNTALNKEGQAQGESPLNEHKLMSAEAVAQAIVHGVKKRRRTLLLSTQGKLTVWLNKFFPAFMDRQVYRVVSKEKDSPF